MNKNLTDREKVNFIDEGDAIKTHEGMVFGRMYADWKKQKGYDYGNCTIYTYKQL